MPWLAAVRRDETLVMEATNGRPFPVDRPYSGEILSEAGSPSTRFRLICGYARVAAFFPATRPKTTQSAIETVPRRTIP